MYETLQLLDLNMFKTTPISTLLGTIQDKPGTGRDPIRQTCSHHCVSSANTYQIRKLNMHNLGRHIAIFLALITTVNISFSQTKKAAATEPAPSCFISEFRHIGLSVHEPIERAHQAKRWLAQNLTACPVEKLNLINANRTSWLGTSDSSYFMNLLDSMIEYKLAGKPEMLAQIYGSLGKEGVSSPQVMSVTLAPRAQQVQPSYDNQQYQQYPQYQQQPYPQAQQPPAYPPAAYPQANPGGR